MELMPRDCHIRDFIPRIPQCLALWALEDINKHDLAVMIEICLQPDFSDILPYYNEAVENRIVEPNLPAPLLWPYQVERIKDWLREER